jgi:hypothetical protein
LRSKVADFQLQTAPQVEAKDEAWFFAQLSTRCPEVYARGKEFFLLCPFHADTSIGSFSVKRHTGQFKCFSCGASGGWNKLAAQIGAEKLKFIGGSTRRFKKKRTPEDEEPARFLPIDAASDNLVRAITKMGIRPQDREKKGDLHRPLVEPWPEDREWRGLTADFLCELGCVRVIDLRHNVERIGLPVRTPDGGLIGYTCRALDPEDADPKYTPLSADRLSWRDKELPAKNSIFLVDKVLEDGWDRVVIVEGPFDALRLYSLGVPAIAILGTNNWTKEKAAILAGLGLRGALVMMDNDDSGQEIQPVILDDLIPVMKTMGLTLPPNVKDPGNLSDKQVQWVKTKLAKL